MTSTAEYLASIGADLTVDPAEHIPNTLWMVRRMVCPECDRRPLDPVLAKGRWTIPWPHRPDCRELAAGADYALPMPELANS